MSLEVRHYQTSAGDKPVERWLNNLKDRQARSRIWARLSRAASGNLGDVQSVGDGVLELRIDWGPGYRIYFARLGEYIVLLLCAGDKRTQQRDIQRAKTYLKDHDARTRAQAPRNGT